MIVYLLRRWLDRRLYGFWSGALMVVIGIVLTIASYSLARFLGGISFIFYGLIIVGIIRMVISAPAFLEQTDLGGRSGRSGPMRATGMPRPAPYVAPPDMMATGRCWFCGGKVKRGAVMCLHCGSSQAGSEPKESEVAQQAGFNPNSAMMAVPRPSDGPAYGPGYGAPDSQPGYGPGYEQGYEQEYDDIPAPRRGGRQGYDRGYDQGYGRGSEQGQGQWYGPPPGPGQPYDDRESRPGPKGPYRR